MNPTPRANRKLYLMLAAIVVGMFGFGYAMVPLYDVFCETLGIRLGDGGTGRVDTETAGAMTTDEERWVTVQFDANVDSRLPWVFKPDQNSLKVKLGELSSATFLAANQTDRPVTGHAVPSVAPAEASIYFAKTECFCFTRQQLAGGEQQHMPVRFIIDPKLPRNIKVLTLSYRFYRSEETAGTPTN